MILNINGPLYIFKINGIDQNNFQMECHVRNKQHLTVNKKFSFKKCQIKCQMKSLM